MPKKIPYKEIITKINDAVIVTNTSNPDGSELKIVYVNSAFTRLVGYAADDVVGKYPRLLQGPDTDPNIVENIHNALIRNEAVHTEILNYRKDSTHFWADLNIIPLKNTTNETTHLAAIVKDLTEYKSLKQELHRLAHMDALIGITNREHFILLAEAEFCRSERSQSPISCSIRPRQFQETK